MPEALESVGTTLTIGSSTLCYVSLGGIGVDGGDAIDSTCLSNSTYLTSMPQSLVKVPELTFTAAYQPEEFANLVAEVNVNQELVINFASPLGGITFWGFLKSFTPNEAGVGERWTVTGSIEISNQNASDVETGPVYA